MEGKAWRCGSGYQERAFWIPRLCMLWRHDRAGNGADRKWEWVMKPWGFLVIHPHPPVRIYLRESLQLSKTVVTLVFKHTGCGRPVTVKPSTMLCPLCGSGSLIMPSVVMPNRYTSHSLWCDWSSSTQILVQCVCIFFFLMSFVLILGLVIRIH